MSSVQNNHGLTINIYNAPPPTTNYAKTGLTLDDTNDTDIDNFDMGDDGGKNGAIDSLPLPSWAKKALKSILGDADSKARIRSGGLGFSTSDGSPPITLLFGRCKAET